MMKKKRCESVVNSELFLWDFLWFLKFVCHRLDRRIVRERELQRLRHPPGSSALLLLIVVVLHVPVGGGGRGQGPRGWSPDTRQHIRARNINLMKETKSVRDAIFSSKRQLFIYIICLYVDNNKDKWESVIPATNDLMKKLFKCVLYCGCTVYLYFSSVHPHLHSELGTWYCVLCSCILV